VVWGIELLQRGSGLGVGSGLVKVVGNKGGIRQGVDGWGGWKESREGLEGIGEGAES